MREAIAATSKTTPNRQQQAGGEGAEFAQRGGGEHAREGKWTTEHGLGNQPAAAGEAETGGEAKGKANSDCGEAARAGQGGERQGMAQGSKNEKTEASKGRLTTACSGGRAASFS